MKQTKKRVIFFLLALSMLISLFGCASDPEKTTGVGIDPGPATQNQTETNGETETVPPPPPALPQHMNHLTGLECDPALVGKRPVSVVFNNLKASLPQCGLSQCDIIYEALAEGGILRLEGIVLDYQKVKRFGSIRSARPYFVELSLAYDSIFVHAGGSDVAYDRIKNLRVNDVDGVKNGPFSVDGTSVFWRDKDRIKQGVSLEHTMFTGGNTIALAIASRGYRTELNNKSMTAFSFDPAFSGIGSGKSATYVKIPHSNYSVSEFYYNETSGLYEHQQYRKDHVDGDTGEKIATENVFLIFTRQNPFPGGGETLDITLTGEGKGYYCNGGEVASIIWKRDSQTGPFTYYNEDGSELKVACGRSYVSIVDNSTRSSVVIS